MPSCACWKELLASLPSLPAVWLPRCVRYALASNLTPKAGRHAITSTMAAVRCLPALALPSPLTLRVRMRPVVNLHHVLDRQLRVTLRGRETLVAEHLLDGAQVGAFFQHVRAEGMAQRVRMHVGRESARHRDLLHDAAHAARGEPRPAQVDQQRSLNRALGFAQHALPRWQIGLHRCLRRVTERYKSL